MASDGDRRFLARRSRRWTMRVPGHLSAVRTARLAVGRWLDHADGTLVRDARSVVTELVSNAVRYGEPPITVNLILDGDRCRVEVMHAGAQPWARGWPDDGGWGLRIVGGIAERWGLDAGGSRAWCELRTPAVTASAGSTDDGERARPVVDHP